MAKDKDMDKFKIGDAVKRQVTPQSAAQMAPGKKKDKDGGKQPEPQSAGFPNIERLIEADKLDTSALKVRVEALEELSRKGDMKQKGHAKKALAAYQHTFELLDYLWSTKEALATGGAQASGEKAAPKGGKKSK